MTGGKIRRLSDDLVNKIAAGEVVERPASAIKELVENSLDAGARHVWIAVEAGGKTSLRVRDDGTGMTREDAVASVERHATSKLRAMADLQAIATHGFRGEALPSIGSVAHLTLRTRTEADAGGTEVDVRFGGAPRVLDVGHPKGTTVEVRDLFGSVPARRKFLRSDATEAGHVAETVTLLALSRPDVGFVLEADGRTLLETPAGQSVEDRVRQIFGARFMDAVVQVDGGHDWARVQGFVSRPHHAANGRPTVRVFVNGRAVRDRVLSKAVADAYRAAAAEGKLVEAILFVEAPLHLVDVNVHPAKTEVRFADTRVLFKAVVDAVRAALTSAARGSAPAIHADRVREAVAAYGAGRPARFEFEAQAELPPRGTLDRALVGPADEEVEASLEAGRALTVLGQHRSTYLVATDGVEIVLVDQHTAHERVRYERILMTMRSGRLASQRLLQPCVVALAPQLVALVDEHGAMLERLGYEVAPFGPGVVKLDSVPELLSRRDPAHEIEALLRDFTERGAGEFDVAEPRARLAATLACHSAARAGEALAPPAMAAIVSELQHTEHPTLCPHGRPTMFRIPAAELSRWFERTGWKRQ